MSEKAMALIATEDFPQGLETGLPPSVVAAQKFGERTYQTAAGAVLVRELHDCGVIYAPKEPYIVCVMTRGNEFDELARKIEGVSKIVYDHVSS